MNFNDKGKYMISRKYTRCIEYNFHFQLVTIANPALDPKADVHLPNRGRGHCILAYKIHINVSLTKLYTSFHISNLVYKIKLIECT